MKASHILVSGEVQGVGFRSFTKREAKALGLVGYVRNLPDGRVEVFAQGEKSKINQLIDKLKRGPDSSIVNEVQVSWKKPKKEFNDFIVL